MELEANISKLVYLDYLEHEQEMLTGQRPEILKPEEREFLKWWKQAVGTKPLVARTEAKAE